MGKQGDDEFMSKLRTLSQNAKVAGAFAELRENTALGEEAADKFVQDKDLMAEVSSLMGGLPEELGEQLGKVAAKSFSIHEAARMGDVSFIREFLYKKNSPIDVEDSKGISPLGYAIAANKVDAVKYLLDEKANPNSVDEKRNTALHYAAGYGHNELVKILLKDGSSDPKITNNENQTPIDVAKRNKRNEILKLLK